MKKLILFLILVTSFGFAQPPTQPTAFSNGIKITGGNPTVTSVNFLTTTEADGVQKKIAPINIPIPYTPVNYSIRSQTIGHHLTGIDTRLGQISSTSAGITQRVYFTADNTTVNSVVYFASSLTGKGSTATGSPPALVLGDNTKSFFTKDIISIAQPTATIGYAGTYSGILTVSASPTPNATQQRFTVEIYRTNNLGVPITSGVSGAPMGDLGVTVVAILDSGVINLTAGAITNVSITGILTQKITINTGERLRYHVSAAKIGAGGGSVTFGVYYGTSYNSYYDVPVAITTDAVVNKSTVTGVTDTDALNSLNTLKSNDANVVHKTGAISETITGVKSISNSVAPATSSFVFSNSYAGSSSNSVNAPFQIVNSNSSLGGHIFNSGSGIGLYGWNTSTGTLHYWDSSTSSTGDLLTISKSFVPTSRIDNNGNFKINRLISLNSSTYLDGGGAAGWLTANGTSIYGGGLISAVSGVAKAYFYYESNYALVSGASGVGVKIMANNADAITVETTGAIKINNLSGTGTRTVVTDSNGNLSATSTDTRPYKVYTAYFTQSGTGSPIATVLENTTGATFSFTRNSTGVYTGTLTGGSFNSKAKTAFYSNMQSYPTNCNLLYVSPSSFGIQTTVTNTGVLTDGVLNDGNIEIRIYP